MKVYVPGPLRSYTGNRAAVEADGSTLDELLRDLDRKFPGIRFRMIDEQDRIREHIRLFINQELARDVGAVLHPADELQIICAISGGNASAGFPSISRRGDLTFLILPPIRQGV
jgi:molybdopterin converting factor small subunit